MKKIAVILAVIGLSGCASMQMENVMARNLKAQGQPQAYIDGSYDGCLSGKSAAGSLSYFTKNARRFDSDRLYAQGWNDAYAQCYHQYKSL